MDEKNELHKRLKKGEKKNHPDGCLNVKIKRSGVYDNKVGSKGKEKRCNKSCHT
jgi:hypothetical protein